MFNYKLKIEEKLNYFIFKYLGWFLYPINKSGKSTQNLKIKERYEIFTFFKKKY